MNKIFTVKQVKKFFNILDRLDRTSQNHYDGHYSEGFKPCQQDVFVNRTIKKWFSGKYYKQLEAVETGFFTASKYGYDSNAIMAEQIRIIKVTNIRFNYGHQNTVQVSVYDASKPSMLISGFEVGHNEALDLLGDEISEKEFKVISEMFIFKSLKCDDCNKNVLHKDVVEDGKPVCRDCENKRIQDRIEQEFENRMRKKKKKKTAK